MNRKIIGKIISSTDRYVPLNEECVIWLNKNNEVLSAHKTSNGAGTYLFSPYDRANTNFVEINNSAVGA